MKRTVTAPSPPTSNGASETGPEVLPVRGRGVGVRRPVRVAVGAVLVVVCGLVFALVLARVDQRSPVLVFSRTVQPGQRITATDIGVADVAASGIASLSSSKRDEVLGRVATGRFPAGAVVAAGEVVSAGLADPDVVELPMTLKAGMYPPGLAAGQAVLVVATPGDVPDQNSSTMGGGGPVGGQVVSVQSQDQLGSGVSATVTVAVPKESLTGLAAASAAGQIVLATVGVGVGGS